MRFEPKVGEEFPLTADLVKAKAGFVAELTRSALVGWVLGVGTIALVVAGVLSFNTGSFHPVGAAWAVIGPIFGGVLTHYLPRYWTE